MIDPADKESAGFRAAPASDTKPTHHLNVYAIDDVVIHPDHQWLARRGPCQKCIYLFRGHCPIMVT
jgi:hypothetical protein